MLAIAPMGSDGTHSNQIIVGYWSEVLRAQGHQRLRPTGSRDELDAQGFRTVYLDHGSQISAAQSMLGDIARQHHNIKRLDGHFAPPGYAVTKRGTPPAVGTNHTLRTIALWPFGPSRIALIVKSRPSANDSSGKAS